jgi:uncharacterized protein (DUF983 family)
MNPVVVMVVRGLALRCPKCGKGGIASSLFSLREACPSCGVAIETRTGEASGGMAINLVTTTILATIGVWWFGVFGSMSLLPLMVGLMVGGVAFSMVFHRHACGAWVGALHATADIGEAPVNVQAGSARKTGGLKIRSAPPGVRRMASAMPVATMQSAPENQKAV